MTIAQIKPHSAAYKAAVLIFHEGPMIPAILFTKVDFGVAADIRNGALKRAIESGWLEMAAGGSVDITQEAYEALRAEQKEVRRKVGCSTATSRDINMMQRPPYVPPKRVMRQDIPGWSVRPANFHMFTVV